MPAYRVIFVHARHRTRFELVVTAPTPEDATLAGADALEEKLADSAGQLDDWRHDRTEEIVLDNASRQE